MTLGDYNRELENFDKAKTSYQAAVASDSAVSSAALLALGDLALRENDTEAADSAFSDVVSQFGERHSNFKNIADTHKNLVGTIAPTEVAPAPKEDKERTPGSAKPNLAPLPPLNHTPVVPAEPVAPTPTLGE